MSIRKKKVEPVNAGLTTRGGATKLHSAPVLFNNAPLVQSTVTMFLANALGWVVSLLTGSHLHLDLIGTGAFAVVGLGTLMGENAGIFDRVQLSAGMMTLWGAKLAGFLFFRALQVGNDARLESTLATTSGTSECILQPYAEFVDLLEIRRCSCLTKSPPVRCHSLLLDRIACLGRFHVFAPHTRNNIFRCRDSLDNYARTDLVRCRTNV